MALNVYALTAYFLHHQYDNSKLGKTKNEKIYYFILNHLDSDGIEELDSFRDKTGLFKIYTIRILKNQ